MAEQYNSQFTGQEIDSAISTVRQKENTWDGKQEKLKGAQTQVVGFNAAGEAVPRGTEDLIGPEGRPGAAGADGVTPDIQVGTVTTLPPGQPATVTRRAGSPDSAPVFDFGIPQGKTGSSGEGGAAGVSSFNGRSGAVVPQSGDYTAENISFTPGTGMTAKNVQSAITELFTSGSEGKAKIASAVTAKGVETAADASFDTMQANILAIPAGGLPEDVCTIDVQASDPAGGTVSGGGVASAGMTVTVSAEQSSSHIFNGWKENGSKVSDNNNYTFPVSVNRVLVADFAIPTHVAGVDWDEVILPTTAKWEKICFGNGKFVIISTDGNSSLCSSDGENWQSSTLPLSQGWSGVTFGNELFIAVGNGRATTGSITDSNKAAKSVNGTTWSSITMPTSAKWTNIVHGNDRFVAIAGVNGNKTAWSEDGTSWTLGTLPSYAYWIGLAYGNGVFVATASISNKVAWSTNGQTWTASTLPFNGKWADVTYGNGIFVAVAGTDASQIAWSEDGKTWAASSLPQELRLSSIAYGEGKFVGIASSSSIAGWSNDGEIWEISSLPISIYWTDVAFGNEKFIGIGTNSSSAILSGNK